MKFRWDKKYLYWGVTGFAVICASLLFYFGLFHMDVLWGKVHNLFTVLMPVVWGVHYFSDVIGGFLLSLSYLLFIYYNTSLYT